jgi:phospholipid/cholesterol/gamma-HCH transport system substrate-binding protein
MRRLRSTQISAPVLGMMVVALTLVAFVAVYQKDRFAGMVRGGDEIQATFARTPDLSPNNSLVKIADVEVGLVTGVEAQDDGTTVVTMKVDDGIVERLGSEPRARVRAAIILGGRHFVELQPSGGGEFGGQIPVTATANPEELGDVFRALGPDARDGIRTSVERLDQALQNGAGESLQRALKVAPATGRTAIPVFKGLQGTRPGQDLSTLVPHINALAEALASDQAQLDRLISGLQGTAEGLNRARDPLARAISDLPDTLPQAQDALDSVTSILHTLQSTASSARPTVRELRPLLVELDVALRRGGPVIRELRPLLDDSLPVAQDLVPAARSGNEVLDNLSGPVIERISGPVLDTVVFDFHGTGGYEGNGNDNLLYEELGYLMARGANMSKYVDKNGSFLALALGGGVSSVGGTDISLVQLMRELGVPQFEFDPMGMNEPGSSVYENRPPSPGTAEVPSSEAPSPTADDPLGDALGELLGGSR